LGCAKKSLILLGLFSLLFLVETLHIGVATLVTTNVRLAGAPPWFGLLESGVVPLAPTYVKIAGAPP
jgi:hypothetical protein